MERRQPRSLTIVPVRKTAVSVTLVVLAIIWSMAGCQRTTAEQPPAPSIYAVGDSITEANSPDFPAGRYGSGSWVSHLAPEITVVGGWARGGASTADMVANVQEAPEGSVLVLLAGSNDIAASLPFEETAANLEAIVDKVAVEDVLVSAVPPRDMDPASVTRFNEELEDLAESQGWEFTDPTSGIRNGDRYAPGMTSDGIHPTEAAAAVLGENLSEALLRS